MQFPPHVETVHLALDGLRDVLSERVESGELTDKEATWHYHWAVSLFGAVYARGNRREILFDMLAGLDRVLTGLLDADEITLDQAQRKYDFLARIVDAAYEGDPAPGPTFIE